jgi:hypothetical protein
VCVGSGVRGGVGRGLGIGSFLGGVFWPVQFWAGWFGSG